MDIPKVYDPDSFEKKWYAFWEEKGFFGAGDAQKDKAYSIVMPPPNVTGQLHMGHALDGTIQDILIRFRRMQGFDTLWQSGCDHAGIATQAKVDAALREEGTNRFALGRDKFLERVWQWKEKYGSRITKQQRSLGASCDWQRHRFTMDEGCSKAVREVFVRLYEEGLIYRGTRITNWCPSCHTAISDIEVEHKTEKGHLYHLRYAVEGTDEYIEIATTRPETMFGDTGIAVHPEDERYKNLVGKMAILPLVGRRIPIFADSYVDREFGTGAVKVTPAHDPNDFEMGKRHNLEQIIVINNDGTMAENMGKYAGLDRAACRKKLSEDLQKEGILLSIEEHEHAVGHCSRCDSTIEPLVSMQWFMKMDELAAPALKAAKDGELQFVPARFGKIYCNWLENIRDWCISRQLWWGHRIPAWYCDDCGKMSVSRTELDGCPHCGSKHIRQDEDVLDTWFSSALWPFETLGWPEKTPELEKFYPTDVLVTGYDIIFFWVARMVMLGLKFTGKLPFKYVFLHGLVRDSQGRKMSKSLGNGVDPLEIIDQYGADTLRFMLVTGNTPGNDMRFYIERVESARNFANKLWNASRFMLMNLEGFDKSFVPAEADYSLSDRWILARADIVGKSVTENLEKFELGEAARSIYEFIWNELCDWYIELSKASLYDKENERRRRTTQYVLRLVLERALLLLHPFMPFITEEIWQHIPHEGESIMYAAWPESLALSFDAALAQQQMGAIMETIKAIRNMRAEVNAAPKKRTEVFLKVADEKLAAVFTQNSTYLDSLACAQPVTLIDGEEKPENAMAAVIDGVEIYLPLAELIDVEKETARLEKELANLEGEIARLEKKLGNASFVAKAPAQIVEKEREKQSGYKEKCAAVKERLSYLAALSKK